MLFWALLASGKINMRKVDGWQTLATKLSISRLTSQHDSLLSRCRRTRHLKFQHITRRHHPARTQLIYQWLRRDWRALFGELRENRPVLTLPPFTVLARWSDVVDTLSRNETFRVPYTPHMDGRLNRSLHAGSRWSGGELARQISDARAAPMGGRAGIMGR
jgi:hypothetical protein